VVGVIPGTEGPDQVVLSGGGNRPILTKASTGFTATIWGETHRGYTAADGTGRNSYEMAVDITMTDAIQAGMDVCFSDPAKWLQEDPLPKWDGDPALHIKHSDITYEDYESWKSKDDPSTPFVESPMFTETDLELFCNKGNWVNGKTCHDANLPGMMPEPTPEENCEANKCPFEMAQDPLNFSVFYSPLFVPCTDVVRVGLCSITSFSLQALCSSLKSHQEDYEECVFDYCTTCDETAVEAWQSSEDIQHPQPACAPGMDKCNAEDAHFSRFCCQHVFCHDDLCQS